MGRRLRRLVGALKDKASIGKALALPKLDLLPIRLAIVEATSHDPSSPPPHRHISTILATAGHSSRLVASTCVSSLLDRLHQTRSWAVALKCLIVVHRIAQQGPFILQDQLGFYPPAGGRSSLNLANFRDPSSPEGWAVSSWVRWYARFLESVLQASRVLGYFFNSGRPDGNLEDDVAAMTNVELLKELEALVPVMEEIYRPEFLDGGRNPVVAEATSLVVADLHLLQEELLLRVREGEERIPALSFPELADFVSAVKRLGALLECPALVYGVKATGRLRDSVFRFLQAAPKPSLLTGGANRTQAFSESARFGSGRLVSPEVRFFSCRREYLPV
ncbi:putative clathrin assembly protein At4g40080 [Nymphaea colorata]|uniref:putative clathrin assembly protein At4g40080 n=1 Tax=Nymphaea colorata TaxID=210225 RepID=UPI00129DCB6B|nr:putative clathrin assembly protein At4g40080 [Nymphaea colorata]